MAFSKWRLSFACGPRWAINAMFMGPFFDILEPEGKKKMDPPSPIPGAKLDWQLTLDSREHPPTPLKVADQLRGTKQVP